MVASGAHYGLGYPPCGAGMAGIDWAMDAPSESTLAGAQPPPSAAARPRAPLAVVMERVLQPNRWEAVGFRVIDVIPDEGAYGVEARKLHDDGKRSRWLFPGLCVELFPDECKGYFLNLTSGKPAWFVTWRTDEGDPLMARPQLVSVSYIECDRWMAAEEHVDSLPLPDALCEWLRLFTNEHFKPEPPRRQRAQSFLSPQERDRLGRGG